MSDYLKAQMSQSVRIQENQTQRYKQVLDKIQISAPANTNLISLKVPNRLQFEPPAGSIFVQSKYFSTLQVPNTQSLALKFQQTPRPNEIQVHFKNVPPNLPFINIDALNSTANRKPLQLSPISPADVSVQKVGFKTTLDFLFKEKLSIKKLQFGQMKNLP